MGRRPLPGQGRAGIVKDDDRARLCRLQQFPPGMEPGLEAVSYNDPPNMTYPFGAYVCVVDVDVDSGVTEIRRFYALDDCGTRINPMIIEGQVHGGLTEALAIAMEQEWPMARPAI